MQERNHEEKVAFTSAFETLAILDEHKKDKRANITYPSLNSVKEAKNWVDYNEK